MVEELESEITELLGRVDSAAPSAADQQKVEQEQSETNQKLLETKIGQLEQHIEQNKTDIAGIIITITLMNDQIVICLSIGSCQVVERGPR